MALQPLSEGETIRTAFETIRLHSPRLEVEIGRPGSAYHGTRFDWSGFITQVTLLLNGGAGRHTFCVPESYHPSTGTGGIGLCGEFGIDQPVGYDDARPGELFPKMGIGLLHRPDDGPYSFSRPYQIAEAFPVEVEEGPDQASFSVAPLDCRGYAARLAKTVRVQENRLEIAYRLENTGQKPLVTHEYLHNFVGIDRQLLGTEYRLRLPYPVRFDPQAAVGMETAVIQGHEIGFSVTPHKALYIRPLGFGLSAEPQWEMRLQSSGVGLRESDDFNPVRVAVWGTDHVLSPEIFVGIALQPGETQTWTRQFEFFAPSG
jgi:hypothetical protein